MKWLKRMLDFHVAMQQHKFSGECHCGGILSLYTVILVHWSHTRDSNKYVLPTSFGSTCNWPAFVISLF